MSRKPQIKSAARTELPFVSDRSNGSGGKFNFWDVQPSNNWLDDCKAGAEYARMYMERATGRNLDPLLGKIAMDMVRAGHTNGVVHGFMSAIGRAAQAGMRAVEAGITFAGVPPPSERADHN